MSMRNTRLFLLCSVTFFIINTPLFANAESGSELTVTGTVKAAPCTVAPDTLQGNVDLGKVYTNRLHSAGDSADWSAFTLNLTDCPATTTKIVVHFSGTPDTDYPVYFQNTGASTHVAIEVADTQGARISNTSVRNLTVNAEHQAKIDLKGRMISPQGEATAGSVSGLMELAFEFQ